MSIRLLLISVFTTLGMYAGAQERKTISGSVVDSAGQGLPDVSVMVKGTKTGSRTDGQGIFTISIPASANSLEFSSTGFTAREVKLEGRTTINVTLLNADNAMTEVIVTGFGVKKDTRKLAYSATEIKGAEITKANNANFVDALQGKVAGVMIGQGAGGPSSSAKIRIRGNSRLDPNTQPLVVIDGILIEPGTTGADSWGPNQDFGNVIKNLNPDDYESVTVLKGSAASALYGSKALNGVLLISTKKGGSTERAGCFIHAHGIF